MIDTIEAKKEATRIRARKWHAENRERAAATKRKNRVRNKELNALWRKNNPEKARAMNLAWKAKNREILAAKQREYYQNNKEACDATSKEYREKNKERLSQYHQFHYLANDEKYKERAAKWGRENKDKRYKYCSKWVRNNQSKVRLMRSNARSIKKKATTSDANPLLIEQFHALALRLQSCIGVRFVVDHIIPYRLGGKHHHENLQALPHRLNSQKGFREGFPLWASKEKCPPLGTPI